MKKLALSLVVSASICSCFANAEDLNATVQTQELALPVTVTENTDNSPTYFGYNYIGFGIETATYQETGIIRGIGYKSSVTTSSPVYTSGGLIKVNKYFDFSIDAASTLMPTQSDEKWQKTATGTVIQENKFDSVQSDLKFLLQWKMNNNHRLAIGPNYNLFSMKRHTFIDPKDRTSIPNANLNQEDIATLNMVAGYIYESAPFSSDGMRIKVGALYGMPIYNKATNTDAPDLSFSSTKGSTIDVDGYIGFELTKGLEMGLFGRYSLRTKDEANDEVVGADTVTWPENELETFRYGVSFVWNFDTK